MLVLYRSKRYSWALFIGHLMIEKLLKAYFVQKNESYPPHIHNLLRLSEKAGLFINETQKVDLATITAFNINARYDDYKMSFQKICTSDFTNHWVEKLNQLRSWIKKQIKIS
jgi:HEPN domain-containing protein